MFKELAALLRKGDTILGTIALLENADPAFPKFRLTVHPRLADTGDAAARVLCKPFAIEGTADELDVELPPNLQGFATSVNSQRDVFAQLDKERTDAEAEARKAADEARKKAAAAKTAKPAAAPAKPAAKVPAKPVTKVPAKPAASGQGDKAKGGQGETKPTPAPVTKPTPAEPAPTTVAPPAATPPIPPPATVKPPAIDLF